ncbi:MAG: hypothetical protein IV100_17805 [Myxococcales bacterium]|nr:hypothetical protein [Myxococcales bacterium]
MSQTENPTIAYLKSIGLDESAMAAPPKVTELKPPQRQTFRFRGKIDPELQYFRASRSNPQELAQLIKNDGWRITENAVELDGVKTDADVILARRRDTAAEIERRDKAQRESIRRRSTRSTQTFGGAFSEPQAVDETMTPGGKRAVPKPRNDKDF